MTRCLQSQLTIVPNITAEWKWCKHSRSPMKFSNNKKERETYRHRLTYYCKSFSNHILTYKSLNEINLWQGDNTPARYHMLTNKVPVPGMNFHLFKLFASRVPIDPKILRLLPMFLATIQSLMVRAYCWRYSINLSHKTWRNRVVIHLETPSQLASFHWKWQINYQGENESPVLSNWNPMSYNNECPGKTCPLVQRWHERVTNHVLVGFKAWFTWWNPCLAPLLR